MTTDNDGAGAFPRYQDPPFFAPRLLGTIATGTFVFDREKTVFQMIQNSGKGAVCKRYEPKADAIQC